MTVKIAPSILSADFGRLAEEVKAAEDAGADWIHVDVMDGHFVPNLTIGPMIARTVRRATNLPVDVHLMIEKPGKYVEAFADAGADRITVHQEACIHLHRTVERIHALDVSAGVALNPATPLGTLEEIIRHLDLVLVMSVNPGFGGQRYIPSSTDKLRGARDAIRARGATRASGEGDQVVETELQVDGGITAQTAPEAAEAGATVLVAGSAVYRHPKGIEKAVRALREAVTGGKS